MVEAVLVVLPGLDIVDPTRRLAIGEACRCREPVRDDRRVDESLDRVAEVAGVADIEAFHADFRAELVEMRRDGHIFKKAAERACAVERPLRPAENLDPG